MLSYIQLGAMENTLASRYVMAEIGPLSMHESADKLRKSESRVAHGETEAAGDGSNGILGESLTC